jgi:hypothetical protein
MKYIVLFLCPIHDTIKEKLKFWPKLRFSKHECAKSTMLDFRIYLFLY